MSIDNIIIQEAQPLLLEMNRKIQTICTSLTDEDCYVVNKPSALRELLSRKLDWYQFTQAPTQYTGKDGIQKIALASDSNGDPVMIEQYNKRCDELKEQIEKEDTLLCSIIEDYRVKFEALALKYNMDLKLIYQKLNEIGQILNNNKKTDNKNI